MNLDSSPGGSSLDSSFDVFAFIASRAWLHVASCMCIFTSVIIQNSEGEDVLSCVTESSEFKVNLFIISVSVSLFKIYLVVDIVGSVRVCIFVQRCSEYRSK